MAGFVRVAGKDEIGPGENKVVEVGGIPIALFNVGGTFYAIHNTCLHQGGPLGEGKLNGTVVNCPWHGWRYDVTSGKSLTLPGAEVQRFQVRVEGGDLLVNPEPLKSQ